MVATYSKWRTHATALSLVGLVATILFAILISGKQDGIQGLGQGILALAVAISALFHAMVSTALVIAVRTRAQVIGLHVVVAVASIAVVFGMR